MTKKRYRIQTLEMSTIRQQKIAECNAYFSILRDRHDCKVISFFIHTSGAKLPETIFYAGCYDKSQVYDISAKVKPEFAKNGFVSYRGFGRDAIFLIKSESLATAEFDARGVSNDMTPAAIARRLKTNAKSATTGKILVEKFVEAIA